MMKLVEVSGEGFQGLIGQEVTLFCANYFYTGILEGVNKTQVALKDPSIIYETGPFDKAKWQDAQRLPTQTLYVRLASIESYCKTSKG